MAGGGLGVHKYGCPIEDGDCSEVGSAGGQSLLVPELTASSSWL